MKRIFRVRDYRPDADQDLSDEILAHQELMVEDLVAGGMSEENARAEACRSLGRGAGAHATAAPQARGNLRRRSLLDRLNTLKQDIRHALRHMARNPGFTSVAFLSLALGIGANTAIFSLADAILIRDMPFSEAEELVDLYVDLPSFRSSPLSYPDYQDVLEGTQAVFSRIGAATVTAGQIEQDGQVSSVLGELVTGSYFPLLGVGAVIGRTLLPEDDVDLGGHFVVMLGHALWQSAFDGDPGVLGQTIRINGDAYEIIGVAPPGYQGSWRGLRMDFFVSIQMINIIQGADANQLGGRGLHTLLPKGRLRPGVGLRQVEATLAGISEDLRRQYPDEWTERKSLWAVPTEEVVFNPTLDRLLISGVVLAMGVVGLVLLIACANLTSFLLARATDRRKEIAVRLALGASRGALIRQLLTETLVLALLGGAAGSVLGLWIMSLLPSLRLGLPVTIDLGLGLNGTVLALTGGATLIAGVLFGLAPALQATNPDLAPTLKDGSSGGRRPRRLSLRNLLVVGQVAASLVLLTVATLFLRSLHARGGTDPGFGQEPTAIVHVNLRSHTNPEEGNLTLQRIVDEVSAIPGVRAAGFGDNIPLNPLRTWTVDLNVEGVDPPAGQAAHEIDMCAVGPGFFDALGIPILRGRNFDASDTPGGQNVAIINEVMAERFWPGENPLGRVVRLGSGTEAVVVGVARSAKVRTLGEAPRPFIYLAYGQRFSSWPFLVTRTSGRAGDLLPRMARIVREADPQAVLVNTMTMEEHLGAMLLADRLGARFSSAFAVVALILASIGLYGVVSYAVASRSREMGIRMSLGAETQDMVRMMVGRGMKLVLFGSGLGLILAFLASSVLHEFLFGIPVLDPLVFLGVPAVLLAVGLLAAYMPARRASRVDPVRTLRRE